jgi:hypothetical protein
MKRAGWAVLGAVALLTVAETVSAQDTQYWTQQYGGGADLLGGMVVGSVLDMSTTYYNPAGLVFYKNPSIVLSAKGYEYTHITVEGESAITANLTSTRLAEGPGLFAGSLGHQFAYSLLTRQDFDLRFDARGGGTKDILSEYPGTETYGGEIYFDQNLTELWGGLSWAGNLSDKASVGVTMYGVNRSQRSRAEGLLEAVTTSGETAVAIRTSDIEYSHYRVLWKGGLLLMTSPISAGITVTTPSIGITGSGWALVNRTTVGVDLNGDSTPDDAVSVNFQDKVNVVYKSPVSVAAGAAWTKGDTKVYASAEWFDAIGRYDVLETKPFVSQTEGDTLLNEATQAAAAVLNAGVGLEQILNPKVRFYGSFRTDFSSFVPYQGRSVSFSTWDIYHLSAGSGFTIGRFALTLGASYSFGKHAVDEPFSIGDPGQRSIQLVGTPDVNYQRFKVLAGLNVGLD